MKIQVGDVVVWNHHGEPHDIGIVVDFAGDDEQSDPFIWWRNDQKAYFCDIRNLGGDLEVIGGNDECR